MQKESDHIKYLKHDDIGPIITQGLTELYLAQPEMPIDFLAKWLLNHALLLKNEQSLKEAIHNKNQLQQRHQQKLKKDQLEENKRQEAINQQQEIEKQFEAKIQSHQYHEELLEKELPQYIFSRKRMTGTYIGHLDHPVISIDPNNDEENAHIDVAQPKQLHYMGYSDGHEFMRQEHLALEQGVTGEVFKEKVIQEEAVQEEEVQEGQTENKKVKAEEVNYLYVPDIIKEAKIHFFRIPKLGSYLAVPLVYESCLSEAAFDLALQNRLEYRAKLIECQKERVRITTEFAEAIKEKEDNEEDPQETKDQMENELKLVVDPEEPEFLTNKREFVVCCDTMGQDREISLEDRKWTDAVVSLFRSSWEKNETTILSTDVDLQIEYLDGLTGGVNAATELAEAYEQDEQKQVTEKETQLEEFKDKEVEYNYHADILKHDFIMVQLQDPQIKGWFYNLAMYRVLKFPQLLQCVLYLLGYTREQINIPDTNNLNWKRVKLYLNDKDFMQKVLSYKYSGQKTQPVKDYQMISRLLKRLPKFNQQEVDHYNLGYGRILRWLTLTLHLRKADIQIRKAKQEKDKHVREEKIHANEDIKTKKHTMLEEHKAALTEEDAQNFIQADWEKTFDDENPQHEIPPVVVDEIDVDLESEEIH